MSGIGLPESGRRDWPNPRYREPRFSGCGAASVVRADTGVFEVALESYWGPSSTVKTKLTALVPGIVSSVAFTTADLCPCSASRSSMAT